MDRTSRKFFFAVVICLFLSALSASLSFAASLPQGASEQLTTILEAEEYQPRNEAKNLSRQAWELFQPHISEFFRWLKSLFEGFSPQLSFLPSFPDWLLNLFAGTESILGTILRAAIVLAAIYLIYLVVTPLLSRFKVRNQASETVSISRPIDHLAILAKLASAGRYLELLVQLRIALREQLIDALRLEHSLTDRKLTQLVSSKPKLGELFADTAVLFEQSIFARASVNQDEIRSLYGRFLQGAGGTFETNVKHEGSTLK